MNIFEKLEKETLAKKEELKGLLNSFNLGEAIALIKSEFEKESREVFLDKMLDRLDPATPLAKEWWRAYFYAIPAPYDK